MATLLRDGPANGVLSVRFHTRVGQPSIIDVLENFLDGDLTSDGAMALSDGQLEDLFELVNAHYDNATRPESAQD